MAAPVVLCFGFTAAIFFTSFLKHPMVFFMCVRGITLG